MLEGIEILNTYSGLELGECIFYSIILSAISIFLIVGIIMQFKEKDSLSVVLLICLFMFFGGLTGFTITETVEEANTTYYKVTIDDSVSFNQFNERYEIYEQDGAIYTIYEKG